MRVKKMIRSVFESAAVVHPEMQSPKSRAIYGVDVMLDCHFQPKLLEVCNSHVNASIMVSAVLTRTYVAPSNDVQNNRYVQ